ncbi:MAG: retroviral-like aspartic protease family protein [Oscillospiraceae bacterium]|nr:retroviral-like aspartic protease family protein [Oscillospiraceae bacterium]
MSANAFIKSYTGISRKLDTEAVIEYNGSSKRVDAIWDTGATATCISMNVVSQLNLKPLGKQRIFTPAGEKIVSIYRVNVVLPNNVTAKNIVVCDSDIDGLKVGALIGMDIMSHGDFAVSNFNGKTAFTFRTPSQKKTDYVAELKLKDAIGQPHGKGKRKRK